MAEKAAVKGPQELWELENALYQEGYVAVCGCDEAGAGPLAGPVYAAAVILPRGLELPWLNDSKLVTEKRRDILFDQIREKALSYAVASVPAAEIDELDILNARMKAMQLAIDALPVQPDFALIDGNTVRNIPIPAVGVIKGDALSCSISAASILAKVTRDRLCLEHDALYPMYGIAGHKGYPTAAHMAAVREYGPSPIHRKTFLKFLDK